MQRNWERGAARTAVVLVLGAAAVLFAWHLYALSVVRTDVERRFPEKRATVSMNAFSDVVTIRFADPAKASEEAGASSTFRALGRAIGEALGGALGAAIEPAIERDLNTRARELFDLYAMMLPYRVKVEVGDDAEDD